MRPGGKGPAPRGPATTTGGGAAGRGPAGTAPGRRPWWAIAGLAAIAILTFGLYVWALSRNGMANSYYGAAVKSAALSWKAFFFGALDPGSFITVDKPPAALWVMALSARVFGFSSWSLLLPQALAGVASVLVLYRLVRRWAGHAAGLLAALILALTPVAVLIFRYNNPDAFLTLLLLLAAWAMWAAVENGSTVKLTLAGVALGFAFLTKMLMALLVVPAFIVVYLLCGPGRLTRRLVQLGAPLGALVVSGGWWVAIAELWPESTRPYVGGTTGNSWLDLIFGRSAGYLGSASTATRMSGDPGVLRVFNTALGGQISWLIPLALTGLAAGLWLRRGRPRGDRTRAGYLLWGLWSLVMIGVFDFAQGTFHSYYTVVLAPGVAALAAAGSLDLWRLSAARPWLIWLAPAVVAGCAAWAVVLLGRVSGYAPGLSVAVIVLGVLAAVLLLGVLGRGVGFPIPVGGRPVWAGAVVLAIAALLAGPVAYDLSTVSRAVTGNSPAAGPAAARLTGAADELAVDQGLLAYLESHQGDARFLVAVQTSAASVPIILSTGEPVVTIGGYKSRDPVPTATELESMVSAGALHYVLVEGTAVGLSASGPAAGEGSAATRATLRATLEWVTQHGTVVDASEYGGGEEGQTLYYLS